MRLYNLVMTEINKDGNMKTQVVYFSSTDENAAMEMFRVLSLDGKVSYNGKAVTRKTDDGIIIYNIVESDLVLGNKNHIEELSSIYDAYFDVLILHLQCFGEKDVSKMGDIVYRLDIEEMNFYVSGYDKSDDDLKICEIALNQNVSGNYIDLIAENGEYRISLERCELRNIEKLVDFINELTNFFSKKK